MDNTTTLPTQVSLALHTEHTSCLLLAVHTLGDFKLLCLCLLLKCEHSGDGGVDVWCAVSCCFCDLRTHHTLHRFVLVVVGGDSVEAVLAQGVGAVQQHWSGLAVECEAVKAHNTTQISRGACRRCCGWWTRG